MAYTLDDIFAGTAVPERPLNKEQALAALSRAKRQMRRRDQSIRKIHAGQLSPDDLETVLLHRVHAGFQTLSDTGRDAFLRLLLHIDRRSPDLLSTAWGTDRFGPRPGNTLIDGLAAIAGFHERWARPVEAWRPQRRHERARFTDLARHLLARYEVPGFLYTVWFRGDGLEAKSQQAWFVHVGTGGNIRTAADLPLRLTKRMAHELMQAPEDLTAEQALRYGQVLGCGGTREMAAAVNATRLGRSFADEGFWGSVVHFLTRHSHCLDLELVGPIVGYIRYRRFEPQDVVGPDGTLERGPPAEPNLSMKSRSLPKLLRQVERWRQVWTPEMEVPDEPGTASSRKLEYLYLEETDETTGRPLLWTIQELSTARSLANEGNAMGHCLSNKAVSLGKTSIWSVQVRDGERTRRVMTVAIDIDQRVVTQARGRFNANPDRDVQGPAVNPADGGGGRLKGRLSPRERELLSQSHRTLRMWLDREGVAYSQYDLRAR